MLEKEKSEVKNLKQNPLTHKKKSVLYITPAFKRWGAGE